MKKFIAAAATAIVAFANTQLVTIEANGAEQKSAYCNPYWFEQDDNNAITTQNILAISNATVQEETIED